MLTQHPSSTYLHLALKDWMYEDGKVIIDIMACTREAGTNWRIATEIFWVEPGVMGMGGWIRLKNWMVIPC